MSLNWSTEKVKYFNDNPDKLWVKYNKDTPEEYEDVNVETKALIFGSMALGIGSITFENGMDFYARWKVLEKFDDFYLYAKYENDERVTVMLTPDVIVKHIGLGTNVSTETQTKWVNRLSESRDYVKNNISKADINSALKEAKEEYSSFIANKLQERV